MKTKYVLVAHMPEFESRFHHQAIEDRLKKTIPTFRPPSSSLGPHITICQPATMTTEAVTSLKGEIINWMNKSETLSLQLVSWNFFHDKKTNVYTLYRMIDSKAWVYQRLHELHLIALKHMILLGHPRKLHLHQTLGSIKCQKDKFSKLTKSITEAVMEGYSPIEMVIESYTLYRKKANEANWEKFYVFD